MLSESDPGEPNLFVMEIRVTEGGGTMVASTMTEPADRLTRTCSGPTPAPAVAAIPLRMPASNSARAS
eukprot:11245381-Prorocentrum_lima.AAC.1